MTAPASHINQLGEESSVWFKLTPLAKGPHNPMKVLMLMAEGSSNQGIADRLVITLRAVERYVSTIFTKLGLPSTGSESRRVLAVLVYLRS